MLSFLTDLFKPQAAKAPPITSETSMNFDAGSVEPFLIGLLNNPRFGLPTDLPATIAQALPGIPIDGKQRWQIDGDFDGAKVQINIEVFMDDIDAPDLYFFSTQPVIAEIERELTAFGDLME
ncbi:hypothetical protein J7426_00630 [Tropicibacter sp. R16_0]|uniref:hypothetical protein n=1 Tax=Tropicibacter sp. R16_0 TaxID=2821102 RepID=UPI001ADD1EBE|nr:hypothetical protein [Tropicibacter sp. R16_0]MBO9448743.1 hypothetical protein [Tropicibacter sp. R16_0]